MVSLKDFVIGGLPDEKEIVHTALARLNLGQVFPAPSQGKRYLACDDVVHKYIVVEMPKDKIQQINVPKSARVIHIGGNFGFRDRKAKFTYVFKADG